MPVLADVLAEDLKAQNAEPFLSRLTLDLTKKPPGLNSSLKLPHVRQPSAATLPPKQNGTFKRRVRPRRRRRRSSEVEFLERTHSLSDCFHDSSGSDADCEGAMESTETLNDAPKAQFVTRLYKNDHCDATYPLLPPQSPQNIPRPFWAKLAQAQQNGTPADWSPQLFRVVKTVQEARMPSVSPENGLDYGQRIRSKMSTDLPMGRYFSDGRLIDYVLAYDLDSADEESLNNEKIEFEPFSLPTSAPSAQNHQTKLEKRKIFEHNLKILGLELEYTFAKHSRIGFVLIHAPFKVLMKQAELLKLKMPVYQNDVKKHANLMDGAVNAFLKRFRFLDFDDKVKERIETRDYFCQPFIEQHLECFVNHENPEAFFSRAERSRMVYDLLIRTRYDLKETGDKYRFGVERLVKNKTYTACYPLHDEISYYKGEKYEATTCSDRQLLFENWVKAGNVWKYQPLHLIKNYFGTKIGFYFAWLGYYTRFLYIISIIGVLCVLYGIVTINTDVPSNQICNKNEAGKVLMCPICTKFCDFTPLSASCLYSKITYIFDNSATILFAAIMSIWATLFLEGWKRYHAELAYKWNVFDFEAEEEVLRPEFQFRKSQQRVNPVTQEKEPYIPIYERIFRFSCSGITVLFFLCLVIALVVGIVAYRVIVLQVFFSWGDSFKTKAFILTSVTAACINLVFILIMNYVYSSLALKLTEWECPRTQTEFDNSYTLKVFLFQFINFYSSLFYIAFIKGKFSGPPEQNNENVLAKLPGTTVPSSEGTFKIFGARLEDCDPAGCMVELVIQLFIIMCGKQFFSAFMEIGYPTIMNILRRWRLKLPMESEKQKEERMRQESQTAIEREPHRVSLVERDYCLNSIGEQFLFDEYLEMVIQFGFCTLFVCAFPLAPLFALLNNILEIRLDAYKFIVTQRKPIPMPARNIGIWMTILDLLSKLSVLCNAFVIAFTSDFVPRMFHYLTNEGSLDTYLEQSLSYFNATETLIINSKYPNVTQCRYRDYRRPPCSLGLRDEEGQCDDLYSHSHKWWMLLAFRLIFVLLFEHVVLSIKAIFAYVIPDVPTKIMIQLQRERYLARQAVLQRTDTFSNPNSSRSEQPSDAVQTDPEAVAYQGEDAFETDDVDDFESAKEPSAALRRMYSDRKKPSLSSAASSVLFSQRLPIQKPTSTYPETSISANELTDTSNSLQVPSHHGVKAGPTNNYSSTDSFHTAPSVRSGPQRDAKFIKRPEMDTLP
ncbi:unnamed protein product [Bursaphelenchus okinawaensis]|uniref:Anoctamin n=1 Tax=Bursaphelenchus okinawaensis TaxID=465554 RepID=A0A811KAE9_9BILA|nr:unnamed protein product [Bursaphelenchus okinawaensis]CAG9098994.1 unnamed protein product [Bursaphelenchus okinawaensis]